MKKFFFQMFLHIPLDLQRDIDQKIEFFSNPKLSVYYMCHMCANQFYDSYRFIYCFFFFSFFWKKLLIIFDYWYYENSKDILPKFWTYYENSKHNAIKILGILWKFKDNTTKILRILRKFKRKFLSHLATWKNFFFLPVILKKKFV